jgi:hypothetical protein
MGRVVGSLGKGAVGIPLTSSCAPCAGKSVGLIFPCEIGACELRLEGCRELEEE